ncbi:MAG: class I adenylate-forming enzyme family protein [Thalassobaculales bacterium]
MTGPFPAATVAAYRAAGKWGRRTAFQVFADNAARVPDRLALADAPNRPGFAGGAPARLSYRGLLDRVERLAGGLSRLGLGPGDVLLVQLPNIHELVAAYLAAARLGAVISPVPVQYRQHELAAIVAAARPRAALVAERFGDHKLADLFRAAVPFGGPLVTPDMLDGPADGAPPFADPDSLFTLCWTSGTEGRPKGVPKTHNNWLSTAHGLTRAAGLEDGDVFLLPFPLINAASIGGLMMPWLANAGTLVLHHPFSIEVFLEQMRGEGVHYTIVAPALLASLLRQGEGGLGRVRVLGTGSAPPDPATLAAFEARFGVKVVNFFGSNEGVLLQADAGRIPDAQTRARLFPRDGDQSWRPGSETGNGGHFRLAGPGGERLTGDGEAGEMEILGPALFPGYLRADGLAAGGFDRSRFTADGWFRTGDLFEIVEGGFVKFVGRARELIVRGGMKIAPAELDGLLAAHPAIAEGAVAPYADARLGERVCAFAVLRPGAALTLEQLCAFLEERGVARFKWPERLVILERLPRNPLAKLLRGELAKLAQG